MENTRTTEAGADQENPPPLGIARALVIILIIHVVAIAWIFSHRDQANKDREKIIEQQVQERLGPLVEQGVQEKLKQLGIDPEKLKENP